MRAHTQTAWPNAIETRPPFSVYARCIRRTSRADLSPSAPTVANSALPRCECFFGDIDGLRRAFLAEIDPPVKTLAIRNLAIGPTTRNLTQRRHFSQTAAAVGKAHSGNNTLAKDAIGQRVIRQATSQEKNENVGYWDQSNEQFFQKRRKALEIDKIQGTKYQAPNSNIPNINLHDRNHEQNIAKIGYGRVLAGQSYEALRYNPKSESIFLDATARKKYVHERKVADIGYGRVLRGMMVACIDCTD